MWFNKVTSDHLYFAFVEIGKKYSLTLPRCKSMCHRWYESKQPSRWTLLTCAYSNLWVYFILVLRTKLVYTGSVYNIARIMYRTKDPESFVVKLYLGIATTYMQWDVDSIFMLPSKGGNRTFSLFVDCTSRLMKDTYCESGRHTKRKQSIRRELTKRAL